MFVENFANVKFCVLSLDPLSNREIPHRHVEVCTSHGYITVLSHLKTRAAKRFQFLVVPTKNNIISHYM